MNYIRLEALERQQADKNFSRGQVHIALKQGVLKKEPCICGNTEVQAHHADYKRPLDIMWVCRTHHAELDRIRRRLNPDQTLR